MQETIIRRATVKDIPQLLPLMEQLGYPHDIEEFQQTFEIFMREVDYGVAVAEKGNKIIGFVAWSKGFCFVVPMPRIRIEGIVVDTEHRGQGIGKKLMIFVENFAKQWSPCSIDLTSGIRRAKEGSHEFYKALGYHNEGYMAKLYLRKEV